MSTAAARAFIANKLETAPNEELRTYYESMQLMFEKRLWHQLTLKIQEFVQLPYFFKRGEELAEFYKKFMKDFETKMNQLTLVKICLTIIRHMNDSGEAVSFLEGVSEKINPAVDKEAYVLCLSEIAYIKLEKFNLLEESKKLADKVTETLDTITGADAMIYSAHYKVLVLYYKMKVVSTDFYKNTLMYLVYTPLEEVSLLDQQSLSFSMGIAALISKEIYNFGELLAHPILNSLDGTKDAWLKNFLFAFNSGNIVKYEEYLNSYKAFLEAQPALLANIHLLREKISILALMELVFNRSSEERTIPFPEIATATKLKVDEVELLVMKALSLKLIRGTIDEVNQTVTISWVQPRVLDLNQIGNMKEKVNKWTESVRGILHFVENQTAPELLT